MAGSVTADLIVVSLADSITGWSGASGQLDTEVYKQAATPGSDGAYTYQTGKNTLASCTFTPATNINMTANYTTPHLYWTMRCDVMTFCEALNTGATNSGLMLRVTDGSGNYTQWHVSGSDVWDGGWRTFVLDLTNTADVHSSSGTLSLADVDIITWYTDASNSGNVRIIDNTWLDAVRYGDGLQAESTTTEAFNFDDIAIDDALAANYYGVMQEYFGVLAAQGGIILGDATGSATCNFVSSNEQIVFQDQIVSTSHFKITAVASATATTDIDITGLVCTSVSSTGPEFDFSDTDLNSVDFSDNTLIGMGAIAFASGWLAQRNKFVGCGQITHAGADMDGCIISGYEGAADSAALVYDVNADPDGEMDNMSFTKGTAATHAIEFGTSVPASMTLRGIDFSGYSATDDANDSTFNFLDTSGTITLNLVGCSGNVSVKAPVGLTVTVVNDPVTVKAKAVDVSGSNIENANVHLEATGGYLPVADSVTIANSGTTATVTHTAHGLSTNDKVVIRGASLDANNGVYSITVTGANTYTYTMGSTPGSSPTGTITSTYVVLNGLTNASGEISTSRVFTSNQPMTGRIRKSSAADDPKYKNTVLTGTVDSAAGATFTGVMIED